MHLKSGPVESSIRNQTITKTFEKVRRKEHINIDNSTGRKIEYEIKRLSPSHLKTILRKPMRKKDDPTNNSKSIDWKIVADKN